MHGVLLHTVFLIIFYSQGISLNLNWCQSAKFRDHVALCRNQQCLRKKNSSNIKNLAASVLMCPYNVENICVFIHVLNQF